MIGEMQQCAPSTRPAGARPPIRRGLRAGSGRTGEMRRIDDVFYVVTDV
ncbi:hypothetical protein C7S14_0506 [Burkholderia cepacia]|nr:hypothetical protein C7S14_0506 [Burkholderia cepacia]